MVLTAVDVCWQSKKGNMNEADRKEAEKDTNRQRKCIGKS